MAELKHGTITVTIPDHIPLPEKAGLLTSVELARLEKPRRGLGLACQKTAEAIRNHPGKLAACGVDPDALDAKGTAAEDIDSVIGDLEAVLTKLKQGNALLDVDAHKELRRVLAFVRGQEKFDASIPALVTVLIDYFSNTRPTQESPTPTPEKLDHTTAHPPVHRLFPVFFDGDHRGVRWFGSTGSMVTIEGFDGVDRPV